MLDDQDTSEFSALAQDTASPSHQNISEMRDAALDSQVSTVSSWGVRRDGIRAQRYCDYYCVMSFADYLVWIQKDDDSEPPISFSKA
ncbi:hypothetical protein [Pseudarthrobacter sp. MDT1-22]